MASDGLHEPIDKLKSETINIHGAIVSLIRPGFSTGATHQCAGNPRRFDRNRPLDGTVQ